jgi:hypothetical protein
MQARNLQPASLGQPISHLPQQPSTIATPTSSEREKMGSDANLVDFMELATIKFLRLIRSKAKLPFNTASIEQACSSPSEAGLRKISTVSPLSTPKENFTTKKLTSILSFPSGGNCPGRRHSHSRWRRTRYPRHHHRLRAPDWHCRRPDGAPSRKNHHWLRHRARTYQCARTYQGISQPTRNQPDTNQGTG